MRSSVLCVCASGTPCRGWQCVREVTSLKSEADTMADSAPSTTLSLPGEQPHSQPHIQTQQGTLTGSTAQLPAVRVQTTTDEAGTTPGTVSTGTPQPTSPASSSSSSSSEDYIPDIEAVSPHRWGPAATCPPSAPRPTDAAVGLLYDQSMEQHKGPEVGVHFELPQRIIQVYSTLEQEGLLQRCHLLPPRPATDMELLLAHSQSHIDEVCGLWPDSSTPPDQTYYNKGADLYVSPGTASSARMATGCCVQAVQSVLSGEVQAAVAVVRPPGHHAECARAQGFCFFNNCVVAARAARTHPGVHRVLILDWDVHHGNGIEELLWEDPDILYISIHRDPKNFYPYVAGYLADVGGGPGLGFNMNIPWPRGGMGDLEYEAAFHMVVEPVVSSYQPDLVIVAAGYDAARGDPLGGCNLNPNGYAHMTRSLLQYAGGKAVLCLEGGYNTRVTADCLAACLRVLLEEHPNRPSPIPTANPPDTPQTSTSSAVSTVQQQAATTAATEPELQGADGDATSACVDTAMEVSAGTGLDGKAAADALTAALAGLSVQDTHSSSTATPSTHSATSLTPGTHSAPGAAQAATAVVSQPQPTKSPAAQTATDTPAASTRSRRNAAAAASAPNSAHTPSPTPSPAQSTSTVTTARRGGRGASRSSTPHAPGAGGSQSSGAENFVVERPASVKPRPECVKVLKEVCRVQAQYWPALQSPPFAQRYEAWLQQVALRQRR